MSFLSNPDLAPVSQENRNWSTLNFVALWVGMSVQIPTYMMASSLIEGGMSWFQAILTILFGNAIVLIPILLNGHVGVQHGIPFPVYARASFGTVGANIPAMLRALVACGWFGIQAWIGGSAIYAVLATLLPSVDQVPAMLPAFLGVKLVPFLCFLSFWALNMFVIWRGIECIRFLETWCAPVLLISGIALLCWAYSSAQGFGEMMHAPSQFASSTEFWKFSIPALTAMVGFWATLSLNIADFTRYAKNQKSQIWGQVLGLPTTMTFFAFIGVAVTSATVVIYGEAIWDPIALIRRFDNEWVLIFSMVAVVLATLSTNVAANVVGPANDFSNLAPHKIDFKMGGYLTGILGIAMMPWKLVADPTGYIFVWLVGYSALLGPVAGILLVDYYLIRNMKLAVDDLYKEEGQYTYGNGFNSKAIVALLIGILPNLPGFLSKVHWLPANTVPAWIVGVYDYSWFIGLFLSGIAYLLLMKR